MKDQEYDYFYDDEQDAKYCYPGTNVLKNKLDIKDLDTLHEAERDYSAVRQAELVGQGVTGDFSFKHLCSIHKHLFSDVYSWAGKTRTVDISKGTVFCLVQFIESQFDDLYCKLKKENFLADITDKEEMSERLAYYLGEINMIHPFREGNTRTTALFIEKYLVSLGYDVDNTMFKDKSVYFRNALVRSNYFNNYLNIKEDNSFLIKFYENLLLGKNNNLHSKDLIVEKLFNKEN